MISNKNFKILIMVQNVRSLYIYCCTVPQMYTADQANTFHSISVDVFSFIIKEKLFQPTLLTLGSIKKKFRQGTRATIVALL